MCIGFLVSGLTLLAMWKWITKYNTYTNIKQIFDFKKIPAYDNFYAVLFLPNFAVRVDKGFFFNRKVDHNFIQF